jgi:aminotransferase
MTDSRSGAARFSRRVATISMSATKHMAVLASRVPDSVSLGQGVPSFPTPPHIMEAVAAALRDDPAIGRYTLQSGMPQLRRAIAAMSRDGQGVAVDPETEVGITVGAMEGLLASILTVVERGDEVILPSPTYASHIEQVLLAEGIPVFVPLRAADWGLDLDAIENAITDRTRAVILCNPGNPTGTVFADADVTALCDLAHAHGLWIISDETYDFLVYDAAPPKSPAARAAVRPRVITVGSFSKKYALTGWRVGWVTAAEPAMAQIMKVHDATAICAPTPSQVAALAALSGPQDCVSDMRRILAERRAQCCRRLDALADHFTYVRPRGAFYIMARYRFSRKTSKHVAEQVLNEAGVITIPGGSFGPNGEGHLRLSFGGTESEIDTAFDRIEDWIQRSVPS